MAKIKVWWWRCPKCRAQHGTPTPGPQKCRNCGTKMKKLKDL